MISSINLKLIWEIFEKNVYQDAWCQILLKISLMINFIQIIIWYTRDKNNLVSNLIKNNSKKTFRWKNLHLILNQKFWSTFFLRKNKWWLNNFENNKILSKNDIYTICKAWKKLTPSIWVQVDTGSGVISQSSLAALASSMSIKVDFPVARKN